MTLYSLIQLRSAAPQNEPMATQAQLSMWVSHKMTAKRASVLSSTRVPPVNSRSDTSSKARTSRKSLKSAQMRTRRPALEILTNRKELRISRKIDRHGSNQTQPVADHGGEIQGKPRPEVTTGNNSQSELHHATNCSVHEEVMYDVARPKSRQ